MSLRQAQRPKHKNNLKQKTNFYSSAFKRKYLVIICIILIFSLFSSCAIHRKFPFICFKKECVLSQLHYYDAKESFRRAKINSSVRKKKRDMNRSKERARKDKSYPPDAKLIEKREKDSLDYSKGFAGLCDESKIGRAHV